MVSRLSYLLITVYCGWAAENEDKMISHWEAKNALQAKFPPGTFEEIKREHSAHWLLNVTTVDDRTVTHYIAS